KPPNISLPSASSRAVQKASMPPPAPYSFDQTIEPSPRSLTASARQSLGGVPSRRLRNPTAREGPSFNATMSLIQSSFGELKVLNHAILAEPTLIARGAGSAA